MTRISVPRSAYPWWSWRRWWLIVTRQKTVTLFEGEVQPWPDQLPPDFDGGQTDG